MTFSFSPNLRAGAGLPSSGVDPSLQRPLLDRRRLGRSRLARGSQTQEGRRRPPRPAAWIAALGVFLAAWSGSLTGQTPTALIQQAHGGQALLRLTDYEIRGAAELTDADGTVRAVPFVLKVSGDRSRLEMDGAVHIRQGVFGQWRRDGEAPSPARRVWEGLRDVYLTPFFAVAGLEQYREKPDSPGSLRFERAIQRRTHYGWLGKTPQAELEFDPESRLLSKAVFTTREGGQTPVEIRYSEYARIEGLAVPMRVERQVGDNPPVRFRLESAQLNASHSDEDFRIDYSAGSRPTGKGEKP